MFRRCTCQAHLERREALAVFRVEQRAQRRERWRRWATAAR